MRRPLLRIQLVAKIPLGEVKGRIDHMAVDLPGQRGVLIPAVAAASLVFLAGLGAVGAKTGGASAVVGAGRVLFWGAAAMAATAGIGWLFGTVAA